MNETKLREDYETQLCKSRRQLSKSADLYIYIFLYQILSKQRIGVSKRRFERLISKRKTDSQNLGKEFRPLNRSVSVNVIIKLLSHDSGFKPRWEQNIKSR